MDFVEMSDNFEGCSIFNWQPIQLCQQAPQKAGHGHTKDYSERPCFADAVIDRGNFCGHLSIESWHFLPKLMLNFVLFSNLIVHSSLSGARCHKACKHKSLQSTEIYCLAEKEYQPKYCTVYIAATGIPLISCLAKMFTNCFKTASVGPILYYITCMIDA